MYGNSIQGKTFMAAFFALSSLIGTAIIISENLADTSTVGILWIIVSCLIYMILHEMMHLLFIMIFSGRKIRISFVFPTVSVSCDELFTRKQFIVIAAAPVLILGIILFLLLFLLQDKYKFLLSILLTLNTAASGGDFLQIFQSLKYPRDALFQDRGKETAVYSEEVLNKVF